MTDTAHAAHASLANELRSESAEMCTEAQADLLVCAAAVIDALLAEVREHKTKIEPGDLNRVKFDPPLTDAEADAFWAAVSDESESEGRES